MGQLLLAINNTHLLNLTHYVVRIRPTVAVHFNSTIALAILCRTQSPDLPLDGITSTLLSSQYRDIPHRTSMFTTTRTRSNPYFESPLKASSPMRPKHAVTPVRRPPKRRKLGTGLRNRLFADSDSDQPSERLSRVASRHGAPTRPRSGSQSRRAELSLKIPARAINAQSELSPRKRKRTDKTAPSSDGDSWIETEDEAPQFIAEGEEIIVTS